MITKKVYCRTLQQTPKSSVIETMVSGELMFYGVKETLKRVHINIPFQGCI